MTTKPLQVRVDETVWADVEIAAARQGLNRSEWLRALVTAALYSPPTVAEVSPIRGPTPGNGLKPATNSGNGTQGACPHTHRFRYEGATWCTDCREHITA